MGEREGEKEGCDGEESNESTIEVRSPCDKVRV